MHLANPTVANTPTLPPPLKAVQAHKQKSISSLGCSDDRDEGNNGDEEEDMGEEVCCSLLYYSII